MTKASAGVLTQTASKSIEHTETMTRPYHCSLCRQSGHNYQTCPLTPDSDGLRHLPKWKRYVVRRRREGNCTKCGKPANGLYRCKECYRKKQEKRRMQ